MIYIIDHLSLGFEMNPLPCPFVVTINKIAFQFPNGVVDHGFLFQDLYGVFKAIYLVMMQFSKVSLHVLFEVFLSLNLPMTGVQYCCQRLQQKN